MWEEKDIYWMAGLFDGEGSISIKKRTNGKSDKMYTYVQLDLQSSDEDIVERLLRISQIGAIHEIKRKTSTGKTMYGWNVGRKKDVIRFLTAIYPIMSLRRQAKIKEVVELF